MDILGLLNKTKAYNIFTRDKQMGTISHANLIVSDDSETLELYVKGFVKTLVCKNSKTYCDSCRDCKLIDANSLVDVHVYPKNGGKLSVSDADDIIKKIGVKPIEGDIKVFVILGAQNLNASAQNKLLKTLEEPPKDSFIFLGATNVYTLLTTVLSRVKRFDISPFLDSDLKEIFSKEVENEVLLDNAIKASMGKAGEVLKNLNSVKNDASNIAQEILYNLSSSKEMYKYSSRINKDNIREIIYCLNQEINKQLNSLTNGKTENNKLNYGNLIYLQESLQLVEKSLSFNGNINSLADSICLAVLEGKHKWQ